MYVYKSPCKHKYMCTVIDNKKAHRKRRKEICQFSRLGYNLITNTIPKITSYMMNGLKVLYMASPRNLPSKINYYFDYPQKTMNTKTAYKMHKVSSMQAIALIISCVDGLGCILRCEE